MERYSYIFNYKTFDSAWACVKSQIKIKCYFNLKIHSVFTYSQEDKRRQRQICQHDFWLLQELLKEWCRRPDRSRASWGRVPKAGGNQSGKRRKRKKGGESVEWNRMPGQRAEGQQQKTHCPWVYTQPHPLPRPGPGPFLCSECPHPCGHFSRFPSFIETNHPYFHLKHKKMQAVGTCAAQ